MKIYLGFFLLIFVIVGINTIAQKNLKQRWMWLAYGVTALSMVVFLVLASKPPRYDWFNDFFCYYFGGRLILQEPSQLYSFGGIYGFVNIPIVAFLFTPFTAFNKRIAAILFTILGLLAVVVTCYLLGKLTKVLGWRRIALVGIFVINGPVVHSLWYGNLSHFVLILLLGAWFCLEKQREVWLGILLAIAALIKIPLFLLGVYFTLRGRWRVTAGFGAALLVIVGASLLLCGVELNLAWWNHIKQFSGQTVSAYNVQSVDSFLARLLYDTNGNLRNWNFIEVGWDFKVIRFALLSLLVGTTIWICWRSKPPTTLAQKNLEFSIVLCLALVTSPISWTHYYVFLLLPFTLYIGNLLAVPQGWFWSGSIAVSILLTSLPVINASPNNPVLRLLYSRLLISNYFFGGVLLLAVLLAARWHTSKVSKISPS